MIRNFSVNKGSAKKTFYTKKDTHKNVPTNYNTTYNSYGIKIYHIVNQFVTKSSWSKSIINKNKYKTSGIITN